MKIVAVIPARAGSKRIPKKYKVIPWETYNSLFN